MCLTLFAEFLLQQQEAAAEHRGDEPSMDVSAEVAVALSRGRELMEDSEEEGPARHPYLEAVARDEAWQEADEIPDWYVDLNGDQVVEGSVEELVLGPQPEPLQDPAPEDDHPEEEEENPKEEDPEKEIPKEENPKDNPNKEKEARPWKRNRSEASSSRM